MSTRCEACDQTIADLSKECEWCWHLHCDATCTCDHCLMAEDEPEDEDDNP